MLASCNQGPVDAKTAPPTALAIGTTTSGTGASKHVSLNLGDTTRISYLISDIFGHPVAGAPYFISRDPRVVTVATSGFVTASGGGSTWIAAYVQISNTGFLGDSILFDVTVICTALAKAGIVVSVQDSLTGSKGPFANVSYVAKDTSAFRDSTLIASVPAQVSGASFQVGLAYEHQGSYTVTVTASGYRPWVKSGVAVAKDACHVIPVSLTARLVPL